MQKINFIPHVFLQILQRYANFLFGVLWPCLPTYTHNWVNLWNTSMFICMPKIHFIIHFFPEILHFKESCNLIVQQYFDQQLQNQSFARYGTDEETSITILVFILDYFQEKLMANFFKKSKKIYFGPFLPKSGQKWIFLGKGLCQSYKYSNYLPSCKKSEKTNELFLRKMPNWQTDGQTDNSYFIGPSVRWGSNKLKGIVNGKTLDINKKKTNFLLV